MWKGIFLGCRLRNSSKGLFFCPLIPVPAPQALPHPVLGSLWAGGAQEEQNISSIWRVLGHIRWDEESAVPRAFPGTSPPQCREWHCQTLPAVAKSFGTGCKCCGAPLSLSCQGCSSFQELFQSCPVPVPHPAPPLLHPCRECGCGGLRVAVPWSRDGFSCFLLLQGLGTRVTGPGQGQESSAFHK